MMKKETRKVAIVVVVLAIVALGAWFISGSQGSSIINSGKPKVAASIFPVYDLAKSIAGDEVQVELVLPPGSSPHTFDVTPSLLRKLQNTQKIFVIGQGLDSWANRITSAVDGATLVDLSSKISLREAEEHEDHHDDENEEEHHEEDEEHGHGHEDEHEHEEDEDHDHDEEGHAHGEFDPHYWLDPNSGKLIINTIVETLSEIDPENSSEFMSRGDSLIEQIESKDKEWQDLTRNLVNRDILTFHDAFGYFAEHFGLNVVATFEPFAGREPSPRYLQELQEEIREHNIRHMFLEPQLPASSLETFSRDNNISLGVLDPLGGLEERNSYINLIDYNVKTVVQSLR